MSAIVRMIAASLGFLAFAVGANAGQIIFEAEPGAFPLFDGQRATPLQISAHDWPGVLRAARDVQGDIERVTGAKPELMTGDYGSVASAVLIGTLGQSPLIDDLVRRGKVDTTPLDGKWESFLRVIVEEPLPGVARALVIVGSDKRGTIYGLYDLSEQMGVSPWYWWADVPVVRRNALFVRAGSSRVDGPVVKYRGIFLNDEAPALTNWANEKFGGFNHTFYGHVFELLLRLRANYLWPAMWGSAFADDDPKNAALADEYGIVMGTSHHEPMMRAHAEWARHGQGPWDYSKNHAVLRDFWRGGIERGKNFEQIVSLGMRGDGDEPMSEEANVALLQKIVADQRKILGEVTGREMRDVPQLWALYKEVQEYFEKGMRVPDDVTLLWCDDNWGNIRRLPTIEERKRAGGAGVYYHFDYVGGPRSYKWLNTVPLTKIWEQMHLAWQHEATRIWIVNVGDLKPMEFPIEVFLRYAWNPAQWPYESLPKFAEDWATRAFGAEHAVEIAALVNGYTKLNGLRKPEMLAPDTFSLVNYHEAERVVGEWRTLRARAAALASVLPVEAQAAFMQLVRHPIEACTVVYELYHAAGLNRLYATQGRVSTNKFAARTRVLFHEDAALTRKWDEISDGKWRHFMDQTHLGYTSWQQPIANAMPAVTEVQPRATGQLALAVEGDVAARPGDYPISAIATLPSLDGHVRASRWFELFNRGLTPVQFAIETSEPWLRVSSATGAVGPDVRIEVSADWTRVPRGSHQGRVTIRSGDGAAPLLINVPVVHEADPVGDGFLEVERVVAMEAAHFGRAVATQGVEWQTLPNFGRTVGAVTAFPVTQPSLEPGGDSPRLEYPVHLRTTGEVTVRLTVAPTQAYTPGRGLRCAISFNDEPPLMVDLLSDRSMAAWERMVADGVNQVSAKLRVDRPGRHVLKFWFVDPGVVLQRIVIDCGGVKPSYLGPPESPEKER